MSNGTGLTDTFGASRAVAAAAAGSIAHPHTSHYYGSSPMGLTSPPHLETLGLSPNRDVLNSGANSGTLNSIPGTKV